MLRAVMKRNASLLGGWERVSYQERGHLQVLLEMMAVELAPDEPLGPLGGPEGGSGGKLSERWVNDATPEQVWLAL